MVPGDEILQEIMRTDICAHKRAKSLQQVTRKMLKRDIHDLMELHENETS